MLDNRQPRNKGGAAALTTLIAALTFWGLMGCATNAQTGALLGAGAGAGAGQWIGKDTKGTLIGTGVGAAAGYMIGNEMDKAEAREPRYEERRYQERRYEYERDYEPDRR